MGKLFVSAADVVPATRNYRAGEAEGEADEDCRQIRVDLCNTIGEHLHDFELLAIEEPQALVEMESLQKERQISVDPISLRESYSGEASFNFMLPPVKTATAKHQPPALAPAKPKFISCSLPNSATSSPRFSPSLFKKKWKNESQASPRQVEKLDRQQNQRGSPLWRSKSCGEGRASAAYDEFDLAYDKQNTNTDQHDNRHYGSLTKAEANKDGSRSVKAKNPSDEEFKCGALCLFLPGFGKGKPVRARKEEAVVAEAENVVSRTVSLEKFECGSWASSAIVHDSEDDDGDSMNLYFDLPLELIQSGINDASSPVTAAFVFDKDRKGVLKNVNTKGTARKSHDSSRHVRFSISSPTSPGSCITPRLLKAREDFNAYLEAQSA